MNKKFEIIFDYSLEEDSFYDVILDLLDDLELDRNYGIFSSYLNFSIIINDKKFKLGGNMILSSLFLGLKTLKNSNNLKEIDFFNISMRDSLIIKKINSNEISLKLILGFENILIVEILSLEIFLNSIYLGLRKLILNFRGDNKTKNLIYSNRFIDDLDKFLKENPIESYIK